MHIKQPFVLPHPLPLLGASSGQNMVTSQVRGWAARGLSPAAAWAALSPQPSSRKEAAVATWPGGKETACTGRRETQARKPSPGPLEVGKACTWAPRSWVQQKQRMLGE